MSASAKNPALGYVCAIVAQFIWGGFPIYLSYLDSVDSLDIVAHRIIWSFVLLASILSMSRLFGRQKNNAHTAEPLTKALRGWDKIGLSLAATFLIAANWTTFVWAVSNGYTIDASLGYYICPQVVVLLGVIFLGERLSVIQWVAFALAAFGVGYMIGVSQGEPIVSLAIAFSFGFYGLTKKQIKLTAIGGLTIETGFLLLPAIAFLVFRGVSGVNLFGDNWLQCILVLGTGAATISPLALYATALKHIPLSTVGLLQFIGPTLQFLAGLIILKEEFDSTKLIGFSLVWLGIVLFLSNRFWTKRNQPSYPEPE